MKNTIITAVITFIITLAGCYFYIIRYNECDEELIIKNHQSFLDSRAKQLENKSDSLESELNVCKKNYEAVASEYFDSNEFQIPD